MINLYFLSFTNSIIYSGWGLRSGSHDLYQVHLELVSQSVCNNYLNTLAGTFDPQLMICAGDVENGGRGTCIVSQKHTCVNF